MEIVNCDCCGKIFNHLKGVKICKECDLNIFNSIKSYIENNNNATIYDISEDLKIPVKIVREYIKDDRLILIKSNVLLCKGCFDIIKSGEYCLACSSKFELKNSMSFNSENKEKVKVKFHTRNFRK